MVCTIKDVVGEIRDQATKQRLRVLPYEIEMMEPSAESVTFGKTQIPFYQLPMDFKFGPKYDLFF